MATTYPVCVHLDRASADLDFVFCSVVDHEGERHFPDYIEDVEILMGSAEHDAWGDELELEDVVVPEETREGPPPFVGVVTVDGGLFGGDVVGWAFDFTALEP